MELGEEDAQGGRRLRSLGQVERVAEAAGDALEFEAGDHHRARVVGVAHDTPAFALDRRGASFIIAARYIPIGRVAVNMSAGALGYPRRRFVGLTAVAAVMWASYSAVIGIAFFMSIMFPTIFSLGIHGVGPHTEMGSSLIIMAIVGGALLPPLFGLISDVTHNVQLGYAVPLLCFLYIAWFARVALQDSRAADKAALLNGTSEACLN